MTYLKTAKCIGRQRNRPIKDWTGQKIARLTAIELVERDPVKNEHKWLYGCECGNFVVTSAKSVSSGHTQSCGCLHSEVLARRNRSHGLSKTHEYKVWKDMRSRCMNPRNKEYPNYGGRGIAVCWRWQKFANFFADMGEAPEGCTLDRRDVDGNYEPDNCRWAANDDQANNKRTTIRITINGETKSLAQWSRFYGIDRRKVAYRLKVGIPPEQAFLLGDLRK